MLVLFSLYFFILSLQIFHNQPSINELDVWIFNNSDIENYIFIKREEDT